MRLDYFHNFFILESYHETVLYEATAGSLLPEGYYVFTESYCCNINCDCKAVAIEIELKSKLDPIEFNIKEPPIAILKYTWTKPISINNPYIQDNSTDLPLAKIGLKIFTDYLESNSEYIKWLHKHYLMMKEVGRKWEVDQRVAPPIACKNTAKSWTK